jgi:hypothetical protein
MSGATHAASAKHAATANRSEVIRHPGLESVAHIVDGFAADLPACDDLDVVELFVRVEALFCGNRAQILDASGPAL